MEVKASIKVLKELRLHGAIITTRRGTKAHWCSKCKQPIPAHVDYYEVVYGGSGLGGIKFPERVHIECLEGGEHGSRKSSS